MPELPEVEMIKRILEPQVKGLKICDITVNRADVIAYPKSENFCNSTKNQVISSMDRREKFLMILLESGDKIILHLSNGSELRFLDTRRFGCF